MVFRTILMLIAALWIAFGFYAAENSLKLILESFTKLSELAKYATFLTFFLGMLIYNDDIEMHEDLNYITPQFLKKRYTPCRAWKIYIFMFQLSVIW